MTELTATANNDDSRSRHLDVYGNEGGRFDEMCRCKESVDVGGLRLWILKITGTNIGDSSEN